MRVFDFGSNWQAFSDRYIDDQRLGVAMRSLQTLLQRDSLAGLSVLDVGCGSGLFSLAASRLGASKVIGIDVNPRCIAVCERNGRRLASTTPVTFQEASALSVEQLNALGKFDLVYAWGSLHHSGRMWDAIRNAATCVSPGGTLVLAIYNRHWSSRAWTVVKWLYNQMPGIGQRLMVILFAGIIYVAKFLVTRRNPLNKERGMDFWYDVIDWIGGYPYEYASPDEIEAFMKAQGFTLRHCVRAEVPTGCNELVFGLGPSDQP